MAAGISKTPLSHAEVVEAMTKSISNMEKLIAAFITNNEEIEAGCGCHSALKEFGGFKL